MPDDVPGTDRRPDASWLAIGFSAWPDCILAEQARLTGAVLAERTGVQAGAHRPSVLSGSLRTLVTGGTACTMASKATSITSRCAVHCLGLALCLAWAAATDVYVNPLAGSDSAPGTSTHPVATIHRAVAVAAAASAPAGSTAHAAGIHLASTATGTHRLQQAVVVPAMDAAGVNMTFEFQPWVVDDGDGLTGLSTGKAVAAVFGMAASPFRTTSNATFPPLAD